MAFGGPDQPAVQTISPPPNPSSNDPQVAAATRAKEEQAASLERNARGRASTLLNKGLGDTSTANVSRRTLLGS